MEELLEKTNLELAVLCQQNSLSIDGGKMELAKRLHKAGIKEIKAVKPEEKREKRRGRPRKN